MCIKKLKYFFLLAGLLPVFNSAAITPQCISIGANGVVTITWDVAGTSAANFRSWYVYHSTAPAGPYSAIDSTLLFTDTSYTHPTANAANNQAYYVIAFKSNNGSPDILSDTVHAIGLNINNSGGYANLSWNATHIPLHPGDSPYYLIYREYPTGFFTLIDSIDARLSNGIMTYRDLITICNDTIKYRIEVHNSAGCSSTSALKGDRFQDTQVPTVPPIDSVSVDVFGNAIVSWQISPSTDTKEYIVFMQVPGGVTSVDTVIGINSLTLLTTIYAGLSSQSFFILAVDNCNNISAASTVHSTIFATASFNQCARTAGLIWSPYTFWGTPPQYDILVSVNGGPETLAGSTTNTTFTDTNLTSGSSMCYRIRAVDISTGRTTTSNRACIAPSFPPPPSFCYIRKATVVSDNEISIVGYVDPAAVVSGYNLYRATSASGPFTVVATLSISGTSSVSFVDDVEADRGPYFYYLSALDSCGSQVLASQVVKTMVLEAEANKDYTNTLEWNDYDGWPTGVDHYNLYLTIDGGITIIPIPSSITAPFLFIDSVLDSYYSSGQFCYVVEAVEENGNPFFFLDSSRSNEVCVEQPPLIFIPNAFHPGGNLNEIFYPSNAFVSPEGYSFDIFNRWGELIFHSNNPLEGWPGSSNGVMCPEGVYIYRLIARNGKKADIEKVGGVTLIR